jgi:hypothetical protein
MPYEPIRQELLSAPSNVKSVRQDAAALRQEHRRKKESQKRQSAKFKGAMVNRRGAYDEYTVMQDTSHLRLDGDAVAVGDGYYDKRSGTFKRRYQKKVWVAGKGVHERPTEAPLRVNAAVVASIMAEHAAEKLTADEVRMMLEGLVAAPVATHAKRIRDGVRMYTVLQLPKKGKMFVRFSDRLTRQECTREEECEVWADHRISSDREQILLEGGRLWQRGIRNFRYVKRPYYTDGTGPTGTEYVVLGRGQVAGTDRPDYSSPFVKKGISGDLGDITGAYSARSSRNASGQHRDHAATR